MPHFLNHKSNQEPLVIQTLSKTFQSKFTPTSKGKRSEFGVNYDMEMFLMVFELLTHGFLIALCCRLQKKISIGPLDQCFER